MIFGVGGVFRPGFLTPAQAEELNRMRAALAALDRLGTVPPLTVTRLANGQPVIGMGAGGGAAGSFWARITGSGGGPVAYSWARVELTPSGTYADVTPAVTGENNAYLVGNLTAATGFVGRAAVGDVVRLWASPTRPDSYEFDVEATKVRGKMDAELTDGGSAAMSVWAVTGGVDADTGVNLTVYDWLLSSGQTVAADTLVTAFFDHLSGRWYVDGAACP